MKVYGSNLSSKKNGTGSQIYKLNSVSSQCARGKSLRENRKSIPFFLIVKNPLKM